MNISSRISSWNLGNVLDRIYHRSHNFGLLRRTYSLVVGGGVGKKLSDMKRLITLVEWRDLKELFELP